MRGASWWLCPDFLEALKSRSQRKTGVLPNGREPERSTIGHGRIVTPVSSESPSGIPTPAPQTLRTEDFLRALLRSQLLQRDFVRDFFVKIDPSLRPFPNQVAEAFIRAGHLTRFQAGKLLQGISRGLKLGHFSILSPVARGGTATVYLAMDMERGQLVAVKVLPPNQAKEPRRLARFLREMRLSRVAGNHTNIAPVHESGQIDGIHYIAMEFVSGRSLHKMVQDEGPLSVEQAAFIGMEAALALHHVHLQGLIHRDVKPANIVISSKGQVRLIDFGLAMQENEPAVDESVVGGQGFIVGTMDYIAPEQTFDPSKVDGRADIYGLGCSLYYALTGKPPFQGGTSLERMKRHRSEEPEPLAKLRPDIPNGFLGLVAAMMDKDPNQRIYPAGLLAADLKLWTPGDHVFETVKSEGDDVSRLRMYHPEEISDLEKQLLADDTGSEPKSESHADMHDPTEVETAVRECIDSGSGTNFEPAPSSSEELFLDPGDDAGSSTVISRSPPKSKFLPQKKPVGPVLLVMAIACVLMAVSLWLAFRGLFR